MTGIDAQTWIRASRVDLADSALHAPAAGFGDDDFSPDLYDQAAVLACRIAWNHPLPDGNKRAAWACLVLFLDLNGGTWSPDPPNIDDAVETMFKVAAREVDEQWLANWLRGNVGQPELFDSEWVDSAPSSDGPLLVTQIADDSLDVRLLGDVELLPLANDPGSGEGAAVDPVGGDRPGNHVEICLLAGPRCCERPARLLSPK